MLFTKMDHLPVDGSDLTVYVPAVSHADAGRPFRKTPSRICMKRKTASASLTDTEAAAIHVVQILRTWQEPAPNRASMPFLYSSKYSLGISA